ncbi:MAG: tRNA pseudouridine(55) synthase TruB [Bacilli bacterium]|nr:tRNA pseudouridine(55) synthase TruB [Bacilli bacterium]
MNGILLVSKPKDYTSRDIVNIVSKHLGTKKIGHTGTLDPLATGVLVLCIGKATKFAEILTAESKEYIAEVCLGTETDTYDITGTVLKEEDVSITKEDIEKALSFFHKTYLQQVPIYAAVKVNGKKLYEYAREGIEITPPSKEVTIQNIELLGEPSYQNGKTYFKMKCTVSKGTYIRSLIHDIASYLEVPGTMQELERTKQGPYLIEDTFTLEEIEKGEYQLMPFLTALDKFPKVTVGEEIEAKIHNGAVLENEYGQLPLVFINQTGHPLALYKEYKENLIKPWKMF